MITAELGASRGIESPTQLLPKAEMGTAQQELPVTKTNTAAVAPTRKEEEQAQIPTNWRIKEHHVIESIVDEDGVTWIKIEWSPKLHLFLMLPEHREEKELIAQIQKIGSINTDKWVKMWPQQPELDF